MLYPPKNSRCKWQLCFPKLHNGIGTSHKITRLFFDLSRQINQTISPLILYPESTDEYIHVVTIYNAIIQLPFKTKVLPDTTESGVFSFEERLKQIGISKGKIIYKYLEANDFEEEDNEHESTTSPTTNAPVESTRTTSPNNNK